MADERTRVLFLANSEHGQTNIILAITHELLVQGNVDLHIGSFPVLERRVEKLVADNAAAYDEDFRSRIHFHPVRGPSNTDVFIRTGKRGAFHPPGYHGAVLGFQSLCEDIWGWTEDEYVDIYESCVEIIKEVKPDAIAVDFFFLQGRDAAYNAGHTAILINTTSISHIVLGMQPNSAALWKYPLPGTGFAYPIPWHTVPLNALAVLKTAKMYHGSGRRREIREWRIKHKIHGRFPFADAWRPDRFHISPGLLELDWPFSVMPDNILPCGPILLPTASVQKQDPEMARWLANAPTILVNLGTLYAPDPKVAEEIATGLKMFLDGWKGEKVQILWKLPKHPHDVDDIYGRSIEPLKREMEEDSVRVRAWFEVEPMAMLETGGVVCSVHHGGANSWYEAIQNGVPHVVLPAWQDCYENAARAEWLGIGVYGNKSRAPNISAKELSKALLKVMSNKSYRDKASELAKLCHRKEGRVAAAEKILEIAHSRDNGKLAMRLPEMKTNCPLYEVKNRQGMVLQTAQKPTTAGKGDSKPLLTDVYETLLMTILSNSWLFFPVLGYSLLLIPRLRLFALVYILYIKFISKAHKTGTLSLRNDRFRHSSIWKTTYANYFPLTLYRTVPLPPQRRYIFGYHPHGIALRGAIGAFAAEAADFSQLFPGITNTLLMKDSFYTTPLLREYLLSLGTSGVSRSSCIRHLTRGGHDDRGMGRAITITVGGSREYNIAKPGTMGVVVKIRKGFVRVAVQTGADLVPVIAFGENELFDRVDVNSSTALGLVARAWEFAVGHRVAFSTGRFGLFCPHRRPLNVVVGKPIEVKQQRWEPDEAYIDEVHAQYVRELGKLYDDWKETFAPNKDVKFEVVE
ncbi:Diacylglycerol acyltransferase family [Aspergillus brunneoviolaceus CBS 621.78]|uniref:Diacylglycerol acyltransferase family n=1 Tax=Aspergillus brunneoviolaceus CBS 621.78 TaxID=1450534 RepID=A0ACD1GQW2_9EURO|nr:diacylglycerol acyltransferase family [Aspergillus brunneoviolaceus CBS 621.78]RAH51499.1 diacylglycerol acyltransferase family [Aspergillus brunneoviolaceus CBS 621.78]